MSAVFTAPLQGLPKEKLIGQVVGIKEPERLAENARLHRVVVAGDIGEIIKRPSRDAGKGH